MGWSWPGVTCSCVLFAPEAEALGTAFGTGLFTALASAWLHACVYSGLVSAGGQGYRAVSRQIVLFHGCCSCWQFVFSFLCVCVCVCMCVYLYLPSWAGCLCLTRAGGILLCPGMLCSGHLHHKPRVGPSDEAILAKRRGPQFLRGLFPVESCSPVFGPLMTFVIHSAVRMPNKS